MYNFPSISNFEQRPDPPVSSNGSGMRVAKRFTHLGQLKGSVGGYMVHGDPIYSLTANNSGLMVRFSNKESIEDFHPGMAKYMSWEDATGEWVHVAIITVFGESMEVTENGSLCTRRVADASVPEGSSSAVKCKEAKKQRSLSCNRA